MQPLPVVNPQSFPLELGRSIIVGEVPRRRRPGSAAFITSPQSAATLRVWRMEMDNRTRFRWAVVAGAIVLCAIAGMFAYNLGLSEGLARAGSDPGAAVSAARWHRPWIFPFFPGLLFVFLWFVVLRALWWGGPYRRGYGWHGPNRFSHDVFDEWHRQAHAGEKDNAGADDPDRRGRQTDRPDRG
jgi:hypothetical protein